MVIYLLTTINEDDINYKKWLEKETKNGIVIMDTATYKKIIPSNFIETINIIITPTYEKDIISICDFKTTYMYTSFIECIQNIYHLKKYIYVIGNSELSKDCLWNGWIQTCKFYDMDNMESLSIFTFITENYIKIKNNVYNYINREENNFIKLIQRINSDGMYKPSRCVPIKSLFGEKLCFSLKNNTFPLITTKKTNLKLVYEELMFFLSGKTDTTILEKKKINIWKPNTSREFLDSRGLYHYPIGDMGPSYSFQFRHFGDTYHTCKETYKNGCDQLSNVVQLLKHDPFNRRIIINLWNANDIDKMALPPCGLLYHFLVSENGELFTILYQRSSDILLAGAWNIASVSLFTILLAHTTGLKPGGITWFLGDVHIYENQLDELKQYLLVEPTIFPKLYIQQKRNNICDYLYEDIKLINYNPHPFFKVTFNT